MLRYGIFRATSMCLASLFCKRTLYLSQFACERIELIKRKISLHDQSNADTPATRRQYCVLLLIVWQCVCYWILWFTRSVGKWSVWSTWRARQKFMVAWKCDVFSLYSLLDEHENSQCPNLDRSAIERFSVDDLMTSQNAIRIFWCLRGLPVLRAFPEPIECVIYAFATTAIRHLILNSFWADFVWSASAFELYIG